MRKATAFLLSAVLLLGLAACGIKPPAPDGEDRPQTVQPQEPSVQDQQDREKEPAGEGEEPVLPPQVPEEETTSDGQGEEVPEAQITASHEDVTLFSAGETFTLSARGIEGVYASDFQSAAPEIAAVDASSGEVTAVAPGTTTVTMHVECEAGQFDFKCIVRCSWKEEEPALPEDPGTDAADLPALEDFFATLQGSYEGLGAMMVIDGDLLDNYYPGLSGIAAVEEVLIQETMMSVANVAVGLVRLSDDATFDDVVAVTDVLNARITAQADGGAWYPASCETWEQGVVTSVSGYVGMFVYPDDAQAMADLFTQTYSN